MFESKNIYGEKLENCCFEPLTGFYRDGFCNTGYEDNGIHTVCVELSHDFLEFSKSKGNDLSTPNPQFNFQGLNAGEKWCLCAGRWLEAYKEGKAPNIFLESTHEETLAIIPREILEKFKA